MEKVVGVRFRNVGKIYYFNPKNYKVKVGDPVVTSYVSDQYQEGILIGYIASIEKNANNLTKSGTITPVVDFQHLREVLVITTLKDTGEKELSSQKASDTQTETQDNTETQKSQE